MTILSAQSIRKRRVGPYDAPRHMIEPFEQRTPAHGMTYGLGPAGYDVRIAERVTLAPGAFALASTIETFDMPRDVLAMVADKSTWARRGVCVQHTVIEPGWRGVLTIELTNHADKPCVIEAGSPIAQIIFHALDEPTEQPYDGKYQDQAAGPQPARVTPEPELRLIEPISGDEDGAIMCGNNRVGYLTLAGDVYGIRDGNATWVANVDNDAEALRRLKLWRKAGA